jgi:hypothetical protein
LLHSCTPCSFLLISRKQGSHQLSHSFFCFEYCKGLHILTFQSKIRSLFSDFSFSRQLLNNFSLISKLGGAYSFQRKHRVKHKQFMVQINTLRHGTLQYGAYIIINRRVDWFGESLHLSPSSAALNTKWLSNFTIIYVDHMCIKKY